MRKSILLCSVLTAAVCASDTNSDEAALIAKLQQTATKSFDQSSFVPDISLILDTSIVERNLDDETYSGLATPGFTHAAAHDHDGHNHAMINEQEGFNLNYAELAIQSSVDPYFDLSAIFHLTESSFEIEEAFVKTRDLPYHLSLKLGKFRSAFGYHNDRHNHAYDFAEFPLIYDLLFKYHGLSEKGVQLQYVLPLSWYMMAGIELLRGENELSFGTEGFIDVEDASQPNLIVGYVKSAFDIGSVGTMLTGISIASGESRLNHLEDEENPHAFSSDTDIYGIDITYKHFLSASRGVSIIGEYLYREMDGTQYVPNALQDGWSSSAPMEKKQGGYYTQVIYQHSQNWRGGVRYSAIVQNDISVNGIQQQKPEDMDVTSLMVEYIPSEFSRIRLQYNHSTALYDEEDVRHNVDEFILQFNYVIGAHGAHIF